MHESVFCFSLLFAISLATLGPHSDALVCWLTSCCSSNGATPLDDRRLHRSRVVDVQETLATSRETLMARRPHAAVAGHGGRSSAPGRTFYQFTTSNWPLMAIDRVSETTSNPIRERERESQHPSETPERRALDWLVASSSKVNMQRFACIWCDF